MDNPTAKCVAVCSKFAWHVSAAGVSLEDFEHITTSSRAQRTPTRLWDPASGDITSLLVELRPPFETESAEGIAFYHGVMGLLEARNAKSDFVQAWIGGAYAADYLARIDNADAVYEKFPNTAACVAAVVLVLMAFTFRSVVVAIKAVVSIGLTLSIVYGSTTLVYQFGLFEGSSFYWFAKTGGVCWVPPILCFALLVGLGLDYHVFLLNRVVEYAIPLFYYYYYVFFCPILASLPKTNGAKSGIEMCFDIGSQHLWCWVQNTPRMQNNKVYATLY